jgi:UDP-N-acetylmuramoylalanine--D-glutamate ligase
MNFPPTNFAGQRFAVYGLGRNGLPVARALMAMGAEVRAWDDSEPSRQQAIAAGITVVEPDLRDTVALVLSPGIPHRLPRPHPVATRAHEAGVPILSDAELLYRAVRAAGSRARFAGITGTNGKSTTTALLAHILARANVPTAAGGNLGTAALALPLLPDNGVYVLEMSSYMLERLATLRFDAAVMLNLSPDHLDRHGDMAAYARTKLAVFDRQGAEDTAIVGVDDDYSRHAMFDLRGHPARRVVISADANADVTGIDGVVRDADGLICDLAGALALPGAHNAQNAAAATALALALGVDRAAIASGLLSYPGLPHRQERVGEIDGVAFINDSKATNAESVARALACYDRVVWIAGGIAKEGGIVALARFFPRVAQAFLIGRDSAVLAATLAEHNVPHREVGTLAAAVAEAAKAARAGAAGSVLLSPACASWDQFTGFDARGDAFRELVAKLETA